MADELPVVVDAVVVEDVQLTFAQLCRACRVEQDQLLVLVEEGVLEPMGDEPAEWRFSGSSLGRARSALRLAHELQLGAHGAALVLDLLEEIDQMRAQLRQAGLA